MTARILLADDHAPTREDIRRTLESDGRFEVCAVASDAAEAVDAAARERPDLCVLDIRMPGSGIAAAWEITARLPTTKVVMLTVSRDDDDLLAALRAGASGYLLKDTDPNRLPHALEDVLAGEAAIPRTLVAKLVREFRERGPRRRAVLAGEPLTSREWEVLELLRDALSTAEIAERLVLTQATVRSHVAAILRKLRVPDRAALVKLFERR
ncbi:MAG TPA: response regulator transcription factor [Gaiellaceae bacterium]|nr:response regulator transcription factor [Gaiellaceae bacterium]